MQNIKDKVIIVTGASSGIGAVSAVELAKNGAKLVLGARRADKLAKVESKIKALGGEAVSVTTDVSKKEDVINLAKVALDKFGRIDVLVNNAGVIYLSMFESLRVDEWDSMIDINIKGVLYGIAAVLPTMQAQKSGHIINISSVAGIKTGPTCGVYSATKFAVRAISEALRQEVGGDIRSTVIMPGYVQSEIKDSVKDQNVKGFVAGADAQNGIPTSSIANAIIYAISQPSDVDVNEITIRPTRQEF